MNKACATKLRYGVLGLGLVMLTAIPHARAANLNLSDSPLFLTQSVPPLTMLTMGRDHKLYYEAYNDASDLNNDGVLDIRYKPDEIDYYGYFDSHKCYTYSSADGRFDPVSATANKRCSGQWSGDFLNYLTTSRMDALRKVFYGGYRSTDTSSLTVLERSHVPQDAHSWGKEYKSVANDGYDIAQYSPLSLPANGTRHLFANTTLLQSGSGEPLLRVLEDSQYRIWEWVSIERAVAGSECNNGSGRTSCETASGSAWQLVPASAGASEAGLQNVTRTTYDTTGYGTYPSDHAAYDSLVANYATAANEFGSGSVGTINGSGNPFGADDNYLTIFQGTLNIVEADDYTFAVDGDDAVEVLVDGSVVAGFYGGHAECNCQTNSGTVTLTAGSHTVEFRHQEYNGGDNYFLYWQRSAPASSMTDYQVRVKVCDSSVGVEDNCQTYGIGSSKPVGLLQEHGENDAMLFGLLTGSYAKNTQGGVLRKNIVSITDEIDPSTGVFLTGTSGIIDTINRLQTVSFGGNYEYECGWITTRPINDGECNMWGNPVAEMMYEGVRYFAGKGAPTSAFSISASGNDDADLGLPLPDWNDPYDEDTGGYPWCSQPFQIVVSDINPSYDTDSLPGSYWGSFSGDISGMNVQTLAGTISDNEDGIAGSHYIGEADGTYDGAPTPKAVASLGTIRGLAPEEPTKQGGYYSGSVAYYGLTNDLHAVDGGATDDGQKLSTFAVALASPLPQIEIPVGGQTITLVPFAKSVGGSSISATEGQFQPTNTIVDFYVETLSGNYGKFRVNFEDVEQGADHDMDAIAEYEYSVNPDDTVTVTMNSTYAAGGIIQHMGYVISGTDDDGIYLEVRDVDTSSGSDPDYFLDTPPGESPDGAWNDGAALPLSASRTFTPGSGSSATLLKNPLWYAAKWGGFQDANDNDIPDQDAEWDANGDGVPDNYFLVTNALTLKQQLDSAFTEIVSRVSSASSASVNSGSLSSDTRVYQAIFNSEKWTGDLLSYPVNGDGTLGDVQWKASENMPTAGDRLVYTFNTETETGVTFEWDNLSAAQQTLLGTQSVVSYVRGDQTKERSQGCGDCVFRNRDSLLGDIVHSDPVFVGAPPFRYPDNWGDGEPENASPYSSFRETYAGRASGDAMIYAGGNDGLLHGFNANTGAERMAYVPGSVYDNLVALSSPGYSHKYYVDGAPIAVDVFYGGSWHTLLVGGLGKGGQAIYALDVTNPGQFTSANADTIVRWEFADTDTSTSGNANGDPDLGYTFSRPAAVRMHNGKWAVVFGNGYNNTAADGSASSTGDAVLYIVDAETGKLMVDPISTETGMAEDPEGNSRPNGLATVAPVDTNGDAIVDYLYAGDLFGNLWKFDVTSSNATQWDIAYKQGNAPLPLFTTTNNEPITVRPDVGRAPGIPGGLMIYFGTGKYIEDADNDVTGATTQTFYAIIDNKSDTTSDIVDGRDDLLQQTIDYELSNTFGGESYELRVTSDNTMDSTHRGWYMDLVSPVNGIEGERQVSDPVLRNNRIIFTTLIPNTEICSSGGTSWLMELDARDGGRLNSTPFDLNNDGYFNKNDFVTYTVTEGGEETEKKSESSGKKSKVGIIPKPAILSTPGSGEDGKPPPQLKLTPGSTGEIETTTENPGLLGWGRQSWRELQ